MRPVFLVPLDKGSEDSGDEIEKGLLSNSVSRATKFKHLSKGPHWKLSGLQKLRKNLMVFMDYSPLERNRTITKAILAKLY